MTAVLLILYGLVAALWASMVVLGAKRPETLQEGLLLVGVGAAGLIWPALALFAAGYYLLERTTHH